MDSATKKIINADKKSMKIPRFNDSGFLKYFFSNRKLIMKYLILLRKEESYSKKNNLLFKLLTVFYQYKKTNLGRRLNFEIPRNTLGKGVRIPHIGPIIINEKARIGDNAVIHSGVTIGANGTDSNGHEKVPRLGNHVYIGSGAKVIGSVYVADYVKIGANTTVNKSVYSKNSLVVGSNFRIIQRGENK